MARDHQACINWETWQRQHRIKTKIKFISQVTTTFRIMNSEARDTLLPSHPLSRKASKRNIFWFSSNNQYSKVDSQLSQFVFSIERRTGSRRSACNRRLSVLLFYDIELRLQHWFRIKILFCGLNETTLWFQQSLVWKGNDRKGKQTNKKNKMLPFILYTIHNIFSSSESAPNSFWNIVKLRFRLVEGQVKITVGLSHVNLKT